VQRIPVSSSNVQSIGYDPDASILEVEFNNGSIYQYSGVPQNEFDGLMAAASKGAYLHAHIKNSYSCIKL
jgi:KTSC domain